MAKKKSSLVRVLGVDPGLQVTGYGVIEFQRQSKSWSDIKVIEAGMVRTKADSGIAVRLERIYSGLESAIDDLKPDVLVIEKTLRALQAPNNRDSHGACARVVCLLRRY